MKLDGIHEYNPDVHYRLYLSRDRGPVVICVQDFDYPDYDANRFLSPDAWDNEAEAEEALADLCRAVVMAWSASATIFRAIYE